MGSGSQGMHVEQPSLRKQMQNENLPAMQQIVHMMAVHKSQATRMNCLVNL